MPSLGPSSKLGLPVHGGMDAQGDVDNDSEYNRGGISSEDEIDSDAESEHGGRDAQVGFNDDSEFECGGTDSDDEITSGGESDGVGYSGPNLGQPELTNILSTFIPFPKLPIELRIKIWKCACFFTRNVDIWAKDFWISTTEEGYDRHRAAPYYFHSYTPPPPLLHVSKSLGRRRSNTINSSLEPLSNLRSQALRPKLALRCPQAYTSIGTRIGSVYCPRTVLETPGKMAIYLVESRNFLGGAAK